MKVNEDLSAKAHNYILKKIIDNSYLQGSLLDPRKIAAELKVSVSPVKLAIKHLAYEGFINIYPRRGSFVANITIQSMLDQMMLREALECQAARLYCGKPVRENLQELLDLAGELEQTLDLDEHLTYEIKLHRSLIALTNSSHLIRVFEQNIQLGLFIRLNIYETDRLAHDDHIELVKKLANCCAEEAEVLMRNHLRAEKPKMMQDITIVDEKGWANI